MSLAAELAAYAPNARRSYVGAIDLPSTSLTAGVNESGRLYNMNLSGGVQVFNLPAISLIKDGYSVIVRAIGSPSGYLSAQVLSPDRQIRYRNFARSNFYLIGRGEVFRFTWLAGLNFWLAECLSQPGSVLMWRTHNGSGTWNGTSAAWGPMFFTANNGDAASFGYNGNAALAPVIGVYECTFGVRFSAAAGGAASGYGYIAAADPAGGSVAQHLGQSYHNFVVNEDDDLMELNFSLVYDTGGFLQAHYLTNTTNLYHWYDSNQARINLLSR